MISRTPASYDALAKEVASQGGASTIKMFTLREVHGADRLGVNVLANIKEKLASNGLGHLPLNLPNNQNEIAFIYKRGSSISKIIDCLTEITEDSDHKILKLVGNDDARKTLEKIKELVCDD